MHTQLSSKKRRLAWWLITAALIAALMVTTTAFAEGEEPADPPESEPAAAETEAPPAEQAPAESPPEEAAPPPEEGTPTESPPEEAVPPPEEGAPSESPPEEETVPPPEEGTPAESPPEEAAGEAPTETEIVEAVAESAAELVDASGEPIDLASQESEELLQGADPYWNVGSTKYAYVLPDLVTPGANCPAGTTYLSTCWESTQPISDALNKIKDPGMLPSDGKLYVEGGTYTEPAVTINGTSWANHALLSGLIGVDGSENTTINGTINITNNTGGFTLQGFTLDDGSGIFFDNNSGKLKLIDLTVKKSVEDAGIEVNNHKGKVILDGVNASENYYNGVEIDNTAGSYSVTVFNSAFNDNGQIGTSAYTGLIIDSNSRVTLDGVAACGNHGDGVKIYDYSTLNIKNAYLHKNSDGVYNSRGYGLYAITSGTGTAYLESVRAYDNEMGIEINGGSLCANNVAVTGSSHSHGLKFFSPTGSAKVENGFFDDNNLYGLYIENPGTIYLNHVDSYNNNCGAWLDNSAGSAPVTITSPSDGSNGFRENDNYGVNILSGGFVTITNVEMNNNVGIGLHVDNGFGSEGVTVNTTIKSWENQFNENGGMGIDIHSNGKVILSKARVEGNTSTGIHVNTKRNIAVSQLEVRNNHGSYGIHLDNSGASDARYVKVTGVTSENNDGGTGLYVESRGYITLKSVQIRNNDIHGAWLDNSAGSKPVTITSPSDGGWWNANNFSGNDNYGVYITSSGFVSIANVTMEDNGGTGLHVDNTSGSEGVTLKVTIDDWINSMDYNGGEGIDISSNGKVILSKTSAEGNNGSGIVMFTKGSIELKRVSAYNNDIYGAYLNNAMTSIPRYVKLTDSSFDSNGNHGLYVTSLGSIIANGLSANRNSIRQIYVCSYHPVSYYDLLPDGWVEDEYSFDGTAGNLYSIDLVSDDFDAYLVLMDPDGFVEDEDNDSGGDLNASIGGTLAKTGTYTIIVKTYNYYYNGNGSYYLSLDDPSYTNLQTAKTNGALLVNFMGSAGVTINQPVNTDRMWGNFFDGNGGNGLMIISDGTIYVDSDSASRNLVDGLHLDNPTSRGSATVKNTRRDWFSSSFNENDENGIFVRTRGNITLKNVNAWQNGISGADLDNYWLEGVCDGFGSIRVLAGSNRNNGFSQNNEYGLIALSQGSIKLVNMYAAYNGNDGAYLKNDFDNAYGSIIIKTKGAHAWNNFERNGGSGLWAESNGEISLKNAGFHNNMGYGAYLWNNGLYVSDVILTNSNFENNGDDGLHVESQGSIITYGISAYGNSIRRKDISGMYPISYYDMLGDSWVEDEYTFYGTAGQWVDIDLVSDDFDAYLVLVDPDGWWEDYDDDSGVGSNARIGRNLNKTGTYTIIVKARYFYDEGAGRYIFSLDDPLWTNPQEEIIYGVSLDNTSGSSGVTINAPDTDYMWENDFSKNNGHGLKVESNGAIHLKNANAWGNYNDGVFLDNSSGTGSVTVTTSSNKRSNHFGGNGDSGLYIKSAGDVYLKNIGAYSNMGGSGIYVNNAYGTGWVTYESFREKYWLNDNGAEGLRIESKGNVTINNEYGLTAWENHGIAGVYIDNTHDTSPNFVKLYRVSAGETDCGTDCGTGISVNASGYIYAKSLSATNNNLNGAKFESADGDITVKGSNFFADNGKSGLEIFGHGDISIKKVDTWNNKASGIYAWTDGGNITLKYSRAGDNKANGFTLNSIGDFYLYKVAGFQNGGQTCQLN